MAPSLRRRRRPDPSGQEKSARASAWRENIESLIWAVALALVIRTFIMAPFKIPSGSMRPTLIEGDRILVNKFIYRFRAPRRGDVIVFRYPDDLKRPFIKRLAAVGGDTVEIRDGKVLVNGEPLDSVGVFHTNQYYNQGEFGRPGEPLQVPADSYYVLGDNSQSSHDSRFWGYVPRRLVIGKAMCIFWPVTRWRALR
jgi:signal peptidase I